MIGRIAGTVEYKSLDHVLIDVRGIGYIVYCSDRTLAALPAIGTATVLYTDFVVREDSQTLYGFTTLKEKEWHRLLTTVQGVGAKASLAILGTLGPDGVSRAIALGDWSAVKSAKGIGPKIAQRIISELKDKAPAIMAMAIEPTITSPQPVTAADVSDGINLAQTPAADPIPAASSPDPHVQADAMSALTNLGYSPSQAAAAVATALSQIPDATSAEVIKNALKQLAPKE